MPPFATAITHTISGRVISSIMNRITTEIALLWCKCSGKRGIVIGGSSFRGLFCYWTAAAVAVGIVGIVGIVYVSAFFFAKSRALAWSKADFKSNVLFSRRRWRINGESRPLIKVDQ
jgi:hypothetical protein